MLLNDSPLSVNLSLIYLGLFLAMTHEVSIVKQAWRQLDWESDGAFAFVWNQFVVLYFASLCCVMSHTNHNANCSVPQTPQRLTHKGQQRPLHRFTAVYFFIRLPMSLSVSIEATHRKTSSRVRRLTYRSGKADILWSRKRRCINVFEASKMSSANIQTHMHTWERSKVFCHHLKYLQSVNTQT